MRNLLKPLRNKIPQIILIILFLMLQAYTNLTLPSYTADIVNIGIQNTDVNFIINTGMKMIFMVVISVIAADIIHFKQGVLGICEGFKKGGLQKSFKVFQS